MTNPKITNVNVSIIQASFGEMDENKNIDKAISLVKKTADEGGQVILLPELFAGPYFCKIEDDKFFALAKPFVGNEMITRFSKLAKDLKVVLPISFFEKDEHHYYNSIAIIDADGTIMGCYRKSHIPDGPGYEEKYYFRGGNSGFKVWDTKYGKIGVGICWDQWFPEAARIMALMGAQMLLYPTAIGSEPNNQELQTKEPWRRVMVGHAVANAMPVIASNRIGNEDGQIFYGYSFIADHQGSIMCELDTTSEGIKTHQFDLEAIAKYRASFGFFRDRRPELYNLISSN